jgi:hypothetical protein
MRCVLVVPVLTACLVLFLAATCPAQQRVPAPQSGLDASGRAALPAPPPIPEPPAGSKVPQDADTPPPFMQRPVAKSAPVRSDRTLAVKPAPASFRGLAWGSELTQIDGLVPVTKPVSLPNTYYRPDELLRLGQAQLRSVAYYFPKGRFTGVGITFEGQDNFFLLKDHLIELYGPGRHQGDRYGWTWPDFFIDLRFRDNVGELRYSHQP